MNKEDEKPTLHLVGPGELTLENMLTMFQKLTGRKPTPAEIEEVRVELAKSKDSDP